MSSSAILPIAYTGPICQLSFSHNFMPLITRCKHAIVATIDASRFHISFLANTAVHTTMMTPQDYFRFF